MSDRRDARGESTMSSDGQSSGHVGPIIFGNEAAREQLLSEGRVHTFRTRDRTTGETWARASRTGPKLADVTVEQVAHLAAPSPSDLREWAATSGFASADAWWDAIESVHGDPTSGYIYEVTLRTDTTADGQ